jgi:hypothetical protein
MLTRVHRLFSFATATIRRHVQKNIFSDIEILVHSLHLHRALTKINIIIKSMFTETNEREIYYLFGSLFY